MSDFYTQQTAALKTITHNTCKIKAEQGVINSLKNDSGENYVTDAELSNNYLTKEVAEETYVNKEDVANTYDSMPLLMSHWDKKDFVSPGWVRADGYWLSGNLYTDAYNKIVEKKAKGDTDVIAATYVDGIEDASNPTCYLIDEFNVAFRLPFVSSVPQIIAQEDEVIITADANIQWYRYYSDGHLEQGGEYYSNSTDNKTINFHIPFANTNYWISKQTGINGNYGDNMYQKYYNVFSLTPNSFNAATYASTGGNKFRWFAKGEAAILPPSQWTENVGLYFKLGNTFANADQMDATALSEKIDSVWNHWTNSDYVIETYEENGSWYRKYKSGWIEQGGQFTGTTVGMQTVTILPMADANYWVSIQRYGTAANGNNAAFQWQQVINATTTGFSAYLSTSTPTSTATIRWMVSGYSA